MSELIKSIVTKEGNYVISLKALEAVPTHSPVKLIFTEDKNILGYKQAESIFSDDVIGISMKGSWKGRNDVPIIVYGGLPVDD